MWTPPANQNIRVRHYILGWGKGIPDMFNQELEEKNRTYIIERLGKLKILVLKCGWCIHLLLSDKIDGATRYFNVMYEGESISL